MGFYHRRRGESLGLDHPSRPGGKWKKTHLHGNLDLNLTSTYRYTSIQTLRFNRTWTSVSVFLKQLLLFDWNNQKRRKISSRLSTKKIAKSHTYLVIEAETT